MTALEKLEKANFLNKKIAKLIVDALKVDEVIQHHDDPDTTVTLEFITNNKSSYRFSISPRDKDIKERLARFKKELELRLEIAENEFNQILTDD